MKNDITATRACVAAVALVLMGVTFGTLHAQCFRKAPAPNTTEWNFCCTNPSAGCGRVVYSDCLGACTSSPFIDDGCTDLGERPYTSTVYNGACQPGCGCQIPNQGTEGPGGYGAVNGCTFYCGPYWTP
jgi:hypothetical protein